MSSVVDFFENSELALAAYSALRGGMIPAEYEAALRQNGGGMSSVEAARFAATYTVIDQFTDSTGVSATIFEKGGQRYVAIRGTELSIGDILADGVLAVGVPAELNQQYIALSK